jgi:hypothetical protein
LKKEGTGSERAVVVWDDPQRNEACTEAECKYDTAGAKWMMAVLTPKGSKR